MDTRIAITPDLEYCLRMLQRSVIYFEPRLASITTAELQEYATRRLLRDHYLHHPKAIAEDLHRYVSSYPDWWEEWRGS